MSLPAESLLAVTGAFPTDPVSTSDAAAAVALPREWSRRVAEFLDAARSKPPKHRTPSYLKTWEALTTTPDDGALIVAIESEDVASNYLLGLQAARAYLRSQWRPLFQDTPTGRELLPPALSEQQRAAAIYVIADDPSTILDEMQAGTLGADQVDAFEAVYPALSDMLNRLIGAEIQKRVARKKSYKVPWRCERVMRVLWGMPMGQPMAQLPEQPKAPPKFTINVKKTDRMQTRSQEFDTR